MGLMGHGQKGLGLLRKSTTRLFVVCEMNLVGKFATRLFMVHVMNLDLD
jgi:hypothetical protein